MAHLTLTSVSEDGTLLHLADADGAEFTLDLDARLRSAIGAAAGSGARQPGSSHSGSSHSGSSHSGSRHPREDRMDSVLRPRDIQARIRAGETPEEVARVAQTSLERIMPYAGPVLDERDHVARRAQGASLRRRGGGEARTLGEAVEAHLRGRNIDPGTVEWDAWRREDGRWSLSAGLAADPSTGGTERTAELTFDLPGNYVVPDNDDAHWLVGDVPDAPAATSAPGDDLAARRRHLSVADHPGSAAAPASAAASGSRPTTDELPLGDDVLDLLRDDSREPGDADADAATAEQPRIDAPLSSTDLDTTDTTGTDTGTDTAASTDAASTDAAGSADTDGEADPPEPRRPARKGRGRASVPSWDEIMFGSKPD